MRLLHRPLRAGGAAVLGLATIALTGAFAARRPGVDRGPGRRFPDTRPAQ